MASCCWKSLVAWSLLLGSFTLPSERSFCQHSVNSIKKMSSLLCGLFFFFFFFLPGTCYEDSLEGFLNSCNRQMTNTEIFQTLPSKRSELHRRKSTCKKPRNEPETKHLLSLLFYIKYKLLHSSTVSV